MKKKFGFTLAEVLITLGIIGVVAALTAPALVKNSGTAKIGPQLAKFMNTVDTACEQLLYEEDVSRLSNALKSGKAKVEAVEGRYLPFNTRDELLEALSKHMIMTEYKNRLQVNKPDGTIYVSNNDDNYKAYLLKDGSSILVRPAYDWGASGIYKGELVEIFYDINGPAGNNKLAKEVFVFGVDDGGYILPFGSAAHKELTKGRGDSRDGNKTCNPNASEESVIGEAFACTGHITDNGWKADY